MEPKPKYPGMQHMTYNESMEFARRLWVRFWNGHPKDEAYCLSQEPLEHYVAEVFHQMIREKENPHV